MRHVRTILPAIPLSTACAGDYATYQTLVRWIRGGAKYDRGEFPQPAGIEDRPNRLS